jgi:hypothetical protein
MNQAEFVNIHIIQLAYVQIEGYIYGINETLSELAKSHDLNYNPFEFKKYTFK